jgi:hypothetical protein
MQLSAEALVFQLAQSIQVDAVGRALSVCHVEMVRQLACQVANVKIWTPTSPTICRGLIRIVRGIIYEISNS